MGCTDIYYWGKTCRGGTCIQEQGDLNLQEKKLSKTGLCTDKDPSIRVEEDVLWKYGWCKKEREEKLKKLKQIINIGS